MPKRKAETNEEYLERRRVDQAARRLADNEHIKSIKNKSYSKNKAKVSEYQYNYRRANPAAALLREALKRARKRGLKFTLTVNDIIIPNFCPILGIPLFISDGKPTDNSPSLDRIIPELGYIPGNIAVISMRANQIKNNGTATEHRMIADWMDACKTEDNNG